MTVPYARGFSTLEQEVTYDHLPVRGALPEWLTGSLLRNGPAQFEVGEQKFQHWFDGLAMLHRFHFEDGNVSYANKFLASPAYTQAQEMGKISYKEFATDPCRSLFKRMASLFVPPENGGNGNVSISKMGKQFVALTEIPLPIEFDPQTLETVGVIHHDDNVAGQHTTAHPHYEPQLRCSINSITNFAARSAYNIFCLPDGQKQRQLIGSIPTQQPSYIHSFSITEHYVILVAYPLFVNPLRLLLSGKPFIENFRWQPEKGTTFYVLDKADGRLVNTYTYQAFFAFHHVNAFERGHEILVDIAVTPDSSIIDSFYLNTCISADAHLPHPELYRYTLPLKGGSVKAEVLSEESIELPRINYERVNGCAYQFVYGASFRKQTPEAFFNQLVKIDVKTGETFIWAEEEQMYPGEPVFVAAPGAKREDDGLVLSVVLDGRRGCSFLLALDAHTFQEVARVDVPHHIPFGFHGFYTRH